MPRKAAPKPLGEYHVVLSRLVRQMEEDPRVPVELKRALAEAAHEVAKLMTEPHG